MKNGKINKEYYDTYFTDKQYSKFKDLNSFFQKYRISKVKQIYTPNKKERVLDLGCGWGLFVLLSPFMQRNYRGGL